MLASLRHWLNILIKSFSNNVPYEISSVRNHIIETGKMKKEVVLSKLSNLLIKNQFSDGALRGQFGTNTDLKSRRQYHDNDREDVILTPQLFLTYMGAQALNYIKHLGLETRIKWVESFTKSCLSNNFVMMLTPFQSPERDDQNGDEAINYRHTAMAHSILIDSSESSEISSEVINKLITENVQSPQGGWPEWSLNKNSSNIIASVYMAHFLFKFQNKFPNAPLHKPIEDIIIDTLNYLDSNHINGFWKQANREATIRFYPTLYLLAYPIYLYYKGKNCKIISEYPKLVEQLSNNLFINLEEKKKIYRTTLRYVLNLYFHSYFSKDQRTLFEKYRDNLLSNIKPHLSELNSHEIFGACVLIDSLDHYEVHDNECFHIFFENSRLIGSVLVKELKQIEPGSHNANRYHNHIIKIFNFLFHRTLENPKKEQIIDGGSKRADIVYFNASKDGFFHNLSFKYNIPSPYIIIECKNYGKEIENPEFDQLAGRLSANSGMFGILACRMISDNNKVISRCRSLVNKGKGYIMILDDNDFINLIERKIEDPNSVDAYLELKMRDILL